MAGYVVVLDANVLYCIEITDLLRNDGDAPSVSAALVARDPR
ncbi:MAG: hypothetical protein ACR2H3_03210 [Acidimicrobiales bacterium]